VQNSGGKIVENQTKKTSGNEPMSTRGLKKGEKSQGKKGGKDAFKAKGPTRPKKEIDCVDGRNDLRNSKQIFPTEEKEKS